MSNSTIALQSAGQVTTVVIGDITYHMGWWSTFDPTAAR